MLRQEAQGLTSRRLCPRSSEAVGEHHEQSAGGHRDGLAAAGSGDDGLGAGDQLSRFGAWNLLLLKYKTTAPGGLLFPGKGPLGEGPPAYSQPQSGSHACACIPKYS